MVTDIPWADILPAGVAVALSPVPIMAVILALFSQQSRRNGLVFLAGWVMGLMALVAVLLYAVDLSKAAFAEQWLPIVSVLKILLGMVFIVLAIVQWRRRPAADEMRPLPAWTARLEAFSPVKTLLVAIGLCVINPKNLTLTLAVMLALTNAGTPTWQNWLGLSVFIVVGSLTIAAPVLYRLFAGSQADTKLADAKQWLQANSTTVMVVVFLLMGALLIGKGLEGIL
jgi:threonine/homoserine/homoserine lactone efflux protein